MDNHQFGDEPSQKQPFVQRTIAAADNDRALVAKEEAVAGGTVRHTAVGQFVFAGDIQLLGRGTGRHDNGVGSNDVAVVSVQFERAFRRVYRGNQRIAILSTEALGLLFDVVSQFEPTDAMDKAGVILDLAGRRNETTGL